MRKSENQNEHDELLNSFEGISRAKISVGFEERLLQKIQFLETPKWIVYFKYGIAAMIILSTINLITIFSINNENEPSRDDYISTISNDIFFDDSTNYFE